MCLRLLCVCLWCWRVVELVAFLRCVRAFVFACFNLLGWRVSEHYVSSLTQSWNKAHVEHMLHDIGFAGRYLSN